MVVDAVASAAVGDLEAGLIALGMRGTATAGRIVSGQIPIAQIPAMAALPSLTFAHAVRATTQGGIPMTPSSRASRLRVERAELSSANSCGTTF